MWFSSVESNQAGSSVSPPTVRAFSFLMPTVWSTGAGAQWTGVDLILIAGPASRRSAKPQEALMAINALAAQATLAPADPVRQFLATSRTYLSVPLPLTLDTIGQRWSSEFVDPPRYRCTVLLTTRRTCA